MQGETDIAKYFIFAERKLNNNRLNTSPMSLKIKTKLRYGIGLLFANDRFAGEAIGKEHLRYVCRHKEHIGR